MTRFTLSQISRLLYNRHYITKERFYAHFAARWGWDESKIRLGWETYLKFPSKLYNIREDEDGPTMSFFEDILQKCTEIVEDITNGSHIPHSTYITASGHGGKDIRKYFYREPDSKQIREFVCDINSASDIISLGELMKRNVQVLDVCRMVEQKQMSDNPNEHTQKQWTDIFQLDFFSGSDAYWGTGKNTIILCCPDGNFRPLIYTKGKGYLRKGEPNIDEEKCYNSYAISGMTRMGNLVTDMHLLDDSCNL